MSDISFKASIGVLPPDEELGEAWRDLEKRANGSFFTSWTWIGAWIQSLKEYGPLNDIRLIRVHRGEEIVGLGIVGIGPRRLRSFGQRSLFLHQTGVPSLDAIYVEYNDFLADASCAPRVRDACIASLAKFSPGHLLISAASDALRHTVTQASLPCVVRRIEECPFTDLTQIPIDAANQVEAFLKCQSTNTRHQIRRSFRLVQEKGALQISRVDTAVARSAALAALMELHTAAWTSRKDLPGAFANPFLTKFVQRLLSAGYDRNEIDLLKIETAGKTLGVLLNFTYRGEVYSYQSGFAFSADNRVKPGLVCHALAAAYYRERGFRGYHFMAGPSRYKKSLSNASETLSWMEIGTPPLVRALYWLAQRRDILRLR